MRQKMVVALGTIMVVLACAGAAFAGHMLTGEVISVNPGWQELTINVGGFPVTFTAKDRAAQALPNVMPGDMVTIATEGFTADLSPYNRESTDWEATAHYIVRLSGR